MLWGRFTTPSTPPDQASSGAVSDQKTFIRTRHTADSEQERSILIMHEQRRAIRAKRSAACRHALKMLPRLTCTLVMLSFHLDKIRPATFAPKHAALLSRRSLHSVKTHCQDTRFLHTPAQKPLKLFSNTRVLRSKTRAKNTRLC